MSRTTGISFLSASAETLYDVMEEQAVWIQSDSSGQGHAWSDVPDDCDYLIDAAVALADENGDLLPGATAHHGGVSYRVRSCRFLTAWAGHR